jgi:hypothetical protein
MKAKTSERKTRIRPYFFGYGKGNVIHAYTPQEWGIGGSPASGSYSTHTLPGLVIVMVLMTVPAVLAPVMVIIGLVQLHLGFILLFLVATVLFTGGWILGLGALRDELSARKFRRSKGLPKPRFGVTDDQAREWFESRPGVVAITRENFPGSTYPFPGEASQDRPQGRA